MALAFRAVEFDSVATSLSGVRPPYLAFAAALILCNVLLALVRFRVVLGKFGFSPTWRHLFSAFSIGQLANQIVLNVIGQSLSRASILTSAGVPMGATVMATIVERLLATGILLSASLVAGWFLMPHFGFDIDHGGAYFLSLVGGFTIVGLATIVVAWRRTEIALQVVAGVRVIARLWTIALLTFLAHLCMLGAYLVALMGLGLEEPTLQTVAALLIVMFVSSLPISLAGWGIRELTAVGALGVIGIEHSTAIAGAIIVGAMSFIFMIAFSAWGTVLCLIPGRNPPAVNEGQKSETLDLWNAKLITICAALVAVTIFFQVRVQLDSGQIIANMADIVALTGLGFAILLLVKSPSRFAAPSRPLFFALAAVSLLIAFGLALGYGKFGWNDWAMINRGFGWLVILGYVAAGVSVALVHADSGRNLILRIFVTAGTTIAAVQLAMFIALRVGFMLPQDAFTVPLEGYANNANAFAFQMVMTAIAALIASRLSLFGKRPRLLEIVLILTGLAIYFANSRAGVGMYVILMVMSVVLADPPERRSAFTIFRFVALGLLAGIMLLSNIPLIVSWFGGVSNQLEYQIGTTFYRPTSDAARWITILDGWYLWLDSPIIGNGLGAYVQSQIEAGQKFLVIHSVPIWLMAEMGLVGLAVVLFGYYRLLLTAARMKLDPAHRAWGAGLIILLICVAAASLVHDLFYQRSFWFLLALGFALPVGLKKPVLQ